MLQQARGLHLYVAQHDLHFLLRIPAQTLVCISLSMWDALWVFAPLSLSDSQPGCMPRSTKIYFRTCFLTKYQPPTSLQNLPYDCQEDHTVAKHAALEGTARKAASPILSSSNFKDTESIIPANVRHVWGHYFYVSDILNPVFLTLH